MKPHPSIFERALAQAGVTAREAAMVGDSLKADIEGARRSGCAASCCAGPATSLAAAGGRHVITSLHDLLRLL